MKEVVGCGSESGLPHVLVAFTSNWQPGSLKAWKAPGSSDRTAISRTVHTYYISVITVSVISKQAQLGGFLAASSCHNWAIMQDCERVRHVVTAQHGGSYLRCLFE